MLPRDLLINSIPGIIVGGLLGGSALAVKHFFDRDKALAKKLSFAPGSFDQDKFLASAYLQLQQYRPFSPEAFDDSGDMVDSILCIEKQVELKEIEITMFHPNLTLRYARSAMIYLKQLLADVELKLRSRAETMAESEETLEELREIVGQIEERLKYHTKQIRGMWNNSDKRVERPLPSYQHSLPAPMFK